MKIHFSKMKSYLLLVFGCLIFAEQIIADQTITDKNETTTETNSSTTVIPTSPTTVIPTSPTTVIPTSPTTVIPTTSTTVSPSAPTTVNPPSVKDPSTGSWTVFSEEGIACIKLDAAIQFRITYEQTEKRNVTAHLNVPKDATVNNNTCEDHKIKLTFEGNSFTMSFKNDSDKISATSFILSFTMDEKNFPDALDQNDSKSAYALNKTEFEVPPGKSYLCKIETKINLENNVVLSMQEVKVEAFRHKKDDSFSDAIECSGDEKINDIVPIAVGCALAVLVIIVLIAYLVGRQRSRQQGYQSV